MQEMGERDGGFTSEAAHIPFSSSSPASPTAAAPAAAAAAHRGGVESRTSENEIERAGGREEEGEGGLELDEAIRFPITITNEHDHRPGSPLTLTPRSLARRAFAADAPFV